MKWQRPRRQGETWGHLCRDGRKWWALCRGGIKIAESVVIKKKNMWGPLWFFYYYYYYFTKPKREREKGTKEKRNVACPWRSQELHSTGGGWRWISNTQRGRYTIPFALGVFKISSSQIKTQTRNRTRLNLLPAFVLIQLEGLCPLKRDAAASICSHNPLRPVQYTEQLSLRRNPFSF